MKSASTPVSVLSTALELGGYYFSLLHGFVEYLVLIGQLQQFTVFFSVYKPTLRLTDRCCGHSYILSL